MKKIFLFLFAFTVFCHAFSQDYAARTKKMVGADKTNAIKEKGIGNGMETVSKTIGPEGGEIIYNDEKVSVKIPQGALTDNIVISIEPIISTVPLATGDGFRLLPEGQHFEKPVTITFKYNEDIVNGSAPEALRIAYQDDK